MAMNYNDKYKQYVLLAESALNEAFSSFEQVPEPLISAMKYSVNAGGKRLRPVLAFAAADMYGNAAAAAPFAAALELIHTYSLIHDDLPCMDNDDYRRGMPSNHKVFGEGMAVLAGDALLNMAFEILFEYILKQPQAYNIKAAKVVASAAGGMGMAGGQSIDLCCVSNPLAGEKELLYIHTHKTGRLITAALVAGAYAANADDEHINVLREIGGKLGILFQ
ncbi:MAG: polyprenyl synthetase family protein, partial [Clostridia bacterium]|nr:polyprenyl synthetase family protein [Clostridia bacterium]